MSKLTANTTNLQEILEAVNNLPDAGGVELPELNNPAGADEIFLNKETIDESGNVRVGTFTIESELSEQDELLAELEEVLNTKATAGDANPILQSKTVSPTTLKQTVVADDGYDGLEEVVINAIPSSYVEPTSTKSATTYTPTTTAQTIAAGTYCSGTQTIAGDANLVPANIVSGKSIFGVAGTATSGGSNGTASFENMVTLVNNTSKDILYGGLIITNGQSMQVPFSAQTAPLLIIKIDSSLSSINATATKGLITMIGHCREGIFNYGNNVQGSLSLAVLLCSGDISNGTITIS